MTKYRIEYNREGCIGAGVCVAFAPDEWVIVNDGKADLIDGEKKEEIWVKTIDEDKLEANKQAAEGCPVDIISIINEETGEKII